MVAASPAGVHRGAPRQRTPSPPPRAALQRAEDDLLQSIDQLAFASTHGAAKPPSGSHDPHALLRRSVAMAAARAAASVAQYPVITATMQTQLTGRTAPIVWTWRTATVGLWYQWPGGHNLLAVQHIANAVLPEPTTLVGIVATLAFQYLGFGLLYGLTRQSVVARLSGTSTGIIGLLRPALQWAWDRALLRGPRGAVLCVCVRDIGCSLAQGLLAPCIALLFSLAHSLAHKRSRRARHDPGNYDQVVSMQLTRILVRAALYPVDATIVRLMADEAGLTDHAYAGFFDCLRRAPAPLYAGFTRALVADLAMGWAAAEAGHALSMLVWRLS